MKLAHLVGFFLNISTQHNVSLIKCLFTMNANLGALTLVFDNQHQTSPHFGYKIIQKASVKLTVDTSLYI